MTSSATSVSTILNSLESHYGPQEPGWPTDPYEFLIWWNCGYPASDAVCSKGWNSLAAAVGITPEKLLRASPAKLAAALKPGGMLPELRAERVKQVAARVKDEYGGDLRAALVGTLPQARKILKSFHSIGDPGADRILLFAGLAPLAAVPSNCPHVLVRMLRGKEPENYAHTYREAQQAIEAEVAPTLEARSRAFLLLKRHGQEVCKRTPQCDVCPVRSQCAYYTGKDQERSARA